MNEWYTYNYVDGWWLDYNEDGTTSFNNYCWNTDVKPLCIWTMNYFKNECWEVFPIIGIPPPKRICVNGMHVSNKHEIVSVIYDTWCKNEVELYK